jgi:hypothetical protein
LNAISKINEGDDAAVAVSIYSIYLSSPETGQNQPIFADIKAFGAKDLAPRILTGGEINHEGNWNR